MDTNYKLTIPYDVQILLDELNNNGYESFVVGGCVRDSFLENRDVNDWDICTNANPQQVLKVFDNYKVIKTGLMHGTVTVIYKGCNYEITTYRVDGEYIDSRRPESVHFVSDLSEDLKRRDFTINALAYNHTGLADYNGGILDIKNKIIRCVGNPNDRFKDDSLRILRALRFASVLGFTIDDNTKSAIFSLKDSLKNISSERIITEFCKLLTGINGVEILREYREVITVFIPEMHDNQDFEQSLEVMKYIPKTHSNFLILRLSAFFGGIQKDITANILKRLKCSKILINQVTLLVENYDYNLECERKKILRFLNKYDIDFLNDFLVLKQAKYNSQKDKIITIEEIQKLTNLLIAENACYKPYHLKITGKDLIEIGIPQGKKVGEILSILMNEVLDENLENDKHILIKKSHQLI